MSKHRSCFKGGKMEEVEVVGGLPEIIVNKDGVYQGNLADYYRWIFKNATNLSNGYHNFRHLFRVAWLCYQACVYYGDKLTRKEKRNLLIAAMFHDVNHSGKKGIDEDNIRQAIAALYKAIMPADRPYFEEIANLIWATEFPHRIRTELLSILEMILRDADVAQVLDVAWMQEVLFGLAEEWEMAPIDVLSHQVTFLENLKFGSEWAKETFPPSAIAAKIAEVRAHLALLDGKDSNHEGAA